MRLLTVCLHARGRSEIGGGSDGSPDGRRIHHRYRNDRLSPNRPLLVIGTDLMKTPPIRPFGRLTSVLLTTIALVGLMGLPASAQRYDDERPSRIEDQPEPDYERGQAAGRDEISGVDDGGEDRAADGDRDSRDRPAVVEGPPPGTSPADYFYGALKRDGKWVDHWRYGLVWYPRDVDDDWRPYTLGRWVLTDEYGWLWESDEPWGWAVYHYGRWAYDEDWGWIWVPGGDWAPAWVDWREGDGHIGWAPLPPEVQWRNGAFDYRDADLGSHRYRSAWVFVPETHILSFNVFRYAAPRSRNVTFVRRTNRTTNYTFVNNTLVNRSLDASRLERIVGRPVVPSRTVEADRPFRRRGPGGQSAVQPPVGSAPGAAAPVAVFRPFDRGTRRAGSAPAAAPGGSPQPRSGAQRIEAPVGAPAPAPLAAPGTSAGPALPEASGARQRSTGDRPNGDRIPGQGRGERRGEGRGEPPPPPSTATQSPVTTPVAPPPPSATAPRATQPAATPPPSAPASGAAAPGIRPAPPIAQPPPAPPTSPTPSTAPAPKPSSGPPPPVSPTPQPTPKPTAPPARAPAPSEAERLNRSQVIERNATPPHQRPPDIDRRQAGERRELRQIQDEQRQQRENRNLGVRPSQPPPPSAAPPSAPPAAPPRPQAAPPPPPPPAPPPKPAAPPPPAPPARQQAAPPPPPPQQPPAKKPPPKPEEQQPQAAPPQKPGG